MHGSCHDQTRSGNARAPVETKLNLSNTGPCSGQRGFWVPAEKRGIGDASVGGAKGDWPVVSRGVNGLSWRLTACIQVTLSKCECRYMQHPYVRAFQSSLVLAMLLLLKG